MEKNRKQPGIVSSRSAEVAEFLQLICGTEEAQAEKEACALEGMLGSEAMQSIYDFLKYGEVYEKRMESSRLRNLYCTGTSVHGMGLYCPDSRYPRFLSGDYEDFCPESCLHVREQECVFYLLPREQRYKKQLWYQDTGKWKAAKRDGKGFRLPSEIFDFFLSPDDPVIEAEGLVALTENGESPKEENCRELNIHLYRG